MRRTLLVLRIYIRRYFLQWLAWRSFAFTLMANQAVTPLIGMAVWTTALPGQSQLSTYYIAVLFVKMATVSYENHTFSTRIFNGDVQDDFLRPHPVVLQPLGENLAIRMWHVILAIPILVFLTIFASVNLSLKDCLIAVPAVVLSAGLQFLFTYTLALSGFWTGQASGVVGIGSTLIFLLGGEAVPIQLAPAAFQPLLKMLPFSSILGFPAQLLSGSLTGEGVLTGFMSQIVWVLIFCAASVITWKTGIRRYTSVGA